MAFIYIFFFLKKFEKVEKTGIISTKFSLRCTPSVILGVSKQSFFFCFDIDYGLNHILIHRTYIIFGWLTKVYVWKRSGPSNVILHRFCLTKGSTLNSQESHPRSVVYVSKPTRAIWRYLLSEFRALLCLSSAQ